MGEVRLELTYREGQYGYLVTRVGFTDQCRYSPMICGSEEESNLHSDSSLPDWRLSLCLLALSNLRQLMTLFILTVK